MRWSCQLALYNIQEALSGTLANMPNRWIGMLLRFVAFPLGRNYSPPSDRLSSQIVKSVMENDEARDELTRHIYYPEDEGDALNRLDKGRSLLHEADEARKKLKTAVRERTIPRRRELCILQDAVDQDVLSEKERDLAREALELQNDLIQVDAFDPDEYLSRCGS